MQKQYNPEISEYTIGQLLESPEKYVIPIYQRNYSWGEKEINQLLQDVIDNIGGVNNYYIGTLVTFMRELNGLVYYDTIDGQQRLTTLSILCSVLKNKYKLGVNQLDLSFECREMSSLSLKEAYSSGEFKSFSITYNQSIKDAYKIIEINLQLKLKDKKNIDITDFCNYFFNQVVLFRVSVPSKTDLNHYFEIMNSRGEQLEKQEVLKAKLLKTFLQVENLEIRKNYRDWFHSIWVACSNFEKYVQMGFVDTNTRKIIFGADWDSFQISEFDDLIDKSPYVAAENKKHLTEAIKNQFGKNNLSENTPDAPDRFNSTINFENFLLHVLRVQTGKDIPLDDKQLLDAFDIYIKNEGVEFVKKFIFNLLKCRFLFDRFIIKREYKSGIDNWSLKRIKKYDDKKANYVNTFGDEEFNEGDNRKILMLLSMFHVSAPTMIYKHWLNGALKYCFDNPEIDPTKYIKYLEKMAKAFVFDRFVAIDVNRKEYFDIIFKNSCELQNLADTVDKNKFNYGCIENNLLFNYLDYLLWNNEMLEGSNSKIKDFEYTFRSSVEHYYPQHPKDGFPILNNPHLDSFGNLCLISHSKNSRLSNDLPVSKKHEYYNENNPTQKKIDSIKQYIMMNKYDPEKWWTEYIDDHNKKMIEIILNSIKN